ncbi:MAG: ferrous iron transporter B [Gemmatimonadaceae bacterium]|nr:ferrous iron transporter B [Gemmatimonadaceae bacterium]
MTVSVGLVGNPNTGKSTLFNALTGLSQRVGNYPGVTVERKAGSLGLPDGTEAELVDLPGVYSLSVDAPDERIAAEVLLEGRRDEIDAVIAIVDAGNLRRNLYLVSQLLEGELPVIVALNMCDVAEARGVRIDAAGLEARLQTPVVPMVANRGRGIDELLRRLPETLEEERPTRQPPPLPPELAGAVDRLLAASGEAGGGPTRQQALRALVDEGGPSEQGLIEARGDGFGRLLSDLRNGAGVSAPLSAIESEARYAWIGQVLDGCVREGYPLGRSHSDRIDRVLTHRVFGLAAFLGLSAILFQGIYAWAAPAMDLVETAVSTLGAALGSSLPEGPLRSLLVDGVVAGVGGVLVFLPQIALLFLLIAILEDCGYMARAALLMDRLLGRLGLSGRSFIPLLSSFACAVPGVMAARTIADRRDRFVTVLVAPLMSCSARLPVYALFIAAFIPERALLGGWVGLQGLTLLAMYSLGAVVAVPVAWLLRRTLLRGESSPFLLELPAYNWPTPRTVLLRVYQASRAFVVRAGSVILAATIVMWALAYYPRSSEIADRYEAERTAAAVLAEEPREARLAGIDRAEAADYLRTSYLGRAGRSLEPVFEPLGWDWRIGMAALASFPAREVIISALGTIYSLGSDVNETSPELRDGLRQARRPDGSPALNVPVALSVMVFFALCAQCMSTLAVIQRETSSWAWPVFSFVYMTALAYAGALAAYRLGLWMGW